MQIESLQLRSVRQLLLNNTSALPHLSAASGMWIEGQTLYVVADDERVMGGFAAGSATWNSVNHNLW